MSISICINIYIDITLFNHIIFIFALLPGGYIILFGRMIHDEHCS